MPGYFMPSSPREGLHPDIPQRLAVYVQDGRAVMDEDIWRQYGPEGRALMQEEVDRLNKELDEQAQARANEPVFIPPRASVPASALERAARDLVKAGVALMQAGNSLKAALPDVVIENDVASVNGADHAG